MFDLQSDLKTRKPKRNEPKRPYFSMTVKVMIMLSRPFSQNY